MSVSAPKATPGAVKLALEKSISLANVRGTGTNGFITVGDVSRHINPWQPGVSATQASRRLGELSDDAIMSLDVDAAIATSRRSVAPVAAPANKLKPPSKRARQHYTGLAKCRRICCYGVGGRISTLRWPSRKRTQSCWPKARWRTLLAAVASPFAASCAPVRRRQASTQSALRVV